MYFPRLFAIHRDPLFCNRYHLNYLFLLLMASNVGIKDPFWEPDWVPKSMQKSIPKIITKMMPTSTLNDKKVIHNRFTDALPHCARLRKVVFLVP